MLDVFAIVAKYGELYFEICAVCVLVCLIMILYAKEFSCLYLFSCFIIITFI